MPLPTAPSRGGRVRGAVTMAVVVLTTLGLVFAGGWAWWTGFFGSLTTRPHCTATATGTTTELDPEQAGNAATIAAISVKRGLPGRAATIGIATAMQESKLINIAHGDRDSLGLFQQRPSQGWGTEAEVQDPVYATNAFYDVLVQVEGYQNLPVTTAAQKVQRSAFPTAYANHETRARLWASTLTGYSPGGLSCVLSAPSSATDTAVGSEGLTARAQKVAQAAADETGRTGRALTTDRSGRTLTFTVAGAESTRLAWALGHWAVARAQGLAVDEVTVADRRWNRGDSDQGWTTLTGTDSGTGNSSGATPSGSRSTSTGATGSGLRSPDVVVRIRVAS